MLTIIAISTLVGFVIGFISATLFASAKRKQIVLISTNKTIPKEQIAELLLRISK